jgi:hypothetical protein
LTVLLWRASNRPVGTEYTTVTELWFEPFTTPLAVVEELACIGGHLFPRFVTALWTSDYGLQDHAESLSDELGRGHSGNQLLQSQRPTATAMSMPTNCAAMNGKTASGAIPAKVSESNRAIVTAGLANDVEAVNQ